MRAHLRQAEQERLTKKYDNQRQVVGVWKARLEKQG